MDVIQDVQDSSPEHHFDETTIKQKYNSLSDQTIESDDSDSSFDCNICFDSAHDPVVTLCGHLYCWVCIFKWLQVQRSSHTVQSQACPVCKADISQATLIPLYCHGPSHTESAVTKHPSDFIPPRPTVSGLQTLFSSENTNSNQQLSTVPYQSEQSLSYRNQPYILPPISSSNLVSTTMSAIINPTIGLIGDLVYARMFGSTDAGLITNPLPGSYAIIEHNNSRLRRHEMQMHKSLNRVSIFLFCCCILCLLLF